jgi:hypothetical protein
VEEASEIAAVLQQGVRGSDRCGSSGGRSGDAQVGARGGGGGVGGGVGGSVACCREGLREVRARVLRLAGEQMGARSQEMQSSGG